MDSAVVIQTLKTESGMVTIIVEDFSYWRTQALGHATDASMREVGRVVQHEWRGGVAAIGPVE